MRISLALVATVAALLVAGCAPAVQSPHVNKGNVWVSSPPHSRLVGLCGSEDCGPYAVQLHWDLTWNHTATGYFVFLGGTQEDDVASSPWVLGGLDCGTSYTLGVQAHDGSGDTSTEYTTVYTTPDCPATVVGVEGAPQSPTCNSTVALNGNVSSAVAGASAGQTVCLANGSWSTITLTSAISQGTPGVIVTAANPGSATVNGFDINTTSKNLTVEGLDMTQGFHIDDNTTGGDLFQFNTMEGWTSSNAQLDAAWFIDPEDDGTASTTDASFEFNQIDNAPQCVQDDSDGGNTFSHNVCGPDIGNGGSSDVHYLQAEGDANETVDNNAFLGPLASGASGHINVYHGYGTDIQFENNITWHVQSDGELQWGDDGVISTGLVENNLAVFDPSVANTWVQIDGRTNSVTGIVAEHNTMINQSGGDGLDILGTVNPTVENNILTGTAGDDYGFASCGTGTCLDNVSADTTAPGTSKITSWTPCWQSTTWTPTDGSPWTPPPAGYYLPVTSGGCANAGVASTQGYQGAIGP